MERAAPWAVVDIGSNSVRLVVYQGLSRQGTPLFNEKVLCGLGRQIAVNGRLDPEGVELAIQALRRFAALARFMRVGRLDAVATAAVRDAADGPEFIARAERAWGLPIRVISGHEEARLSAQGVAAAIPDGDGLIGDLGGGSLELVTLDRGVPATRQETTPLGPLRLQHQAGTDRTKATAIIDRALQALPWLADAKGRSFYAVGGAWRALARLHMAQVNYPLKVLHHYRISRNDGRSLSRLVSGLGKDTLERISGMPRRRLDTLPLAALILDRVLKVARPDAVVFSAWGLREGLLHEALEVDDRARDPLIEAAKALGDRRGRFRGHGQELIRFTDPAFATESDRERRLRHAACHLADLNWHAHPDHRAELALGELLFSPFVGIDHPGRVFLALAMFARYDGQVDDPAQTPYLALLHPEAVARARALGAALRLAQTLSGGAPEVLAQLTLSMPRAELELAIPRALADLEGEVAQRRLAALARALGRASRVVVTG
ncbi:Ppx/GppA phosphatase family protein [Zavarzinia sp. CC-PAN008]|uniref:Ppx/GppA phosphatase family protein n=1 Tax=Zavarzinia sp. CC-PAN008 TaxID=3243332 RepID=UPI003F7466F0